MAVITKIPNDERNQQFYAAIETAPGTPATTGFLKVNGRLDIPVGSPPLADTDDVTGSFMSRGTPSRTIRIPSGNFSAPASYERLPWWARLAVESGGVPTSGSGPDYTYVQEPPLTVDDVNTATILAGVEGNGFRYTGVRATEFNVAIDVDNTEGSWQISGTANAGDVDQLPGSFEGAVTSGTTTTVTMTGAGWNVDEWLGAWYFNDFGSGTGEVRQITSNTADTLTVSTAFSTAPVAATPFRIAGMFPAGVTTLAEEKIANAGTRIWILPSDGTQTSSNYITNRIISASFNLSSSLDAKVFLENAPGTTSGVYGRGALRISGSVRMEFDRYDELAAMKALDEMLIIAEQEGSDLGGGVNKSAKIEVTRAVWNEQTRDTRNNNLTQTLTFEGYYDTPPFRITTVNGQADLD